MKYVVIERATNKEVASYDAKNVKFAPDPENFEAARTSAYHEDFSFLIELKGLAYDFAMYEIDNYDLIIVQ